MDKDLIIILLRILEVVHGDRVTLDAIELELEQVANYHDKLEMLVKYFIQPSTTEEETTDEKPRAKD